MLSAATSRAADQDRPAAYMVGEPPDGDQGQQQGQRVHREDGGERGRGEPPAVQTTYSGDGALAATISISRVAPSSQNPAVRGIRRPGQPVRVTRSSATSMSALLPAGRRQPPGNCSIFLEQSKASSATQIVQLLWNHGWFSA